MCHGWEIAGELKIEQIIITLSLSIAKAGLTTLRWRTQSVPSIKTCPLPSIARKVGCTSLLKKWPDLLKRTCLTDS